MVEEIPPSPPCKGYGVHTSQLSTFQGVDPPQPPLKKGGEFSSSPFTRGAGGDLNYRKLAGS